MPRAEPQRTLRKRGEGCASREGEKLTAEVKERRRGRWENCSAGREGREIEYEYEYRLLSLA